MRTIMAHRGTRVVLVALDGLGDLVLRQPLLTGLADRELEVTVVVRRGQHEILPHLDRRLEAIVTDIEPHAPPGPDVRDHLAALAVSIARVRPDVLVAAAHNRTYVDEWLLHQFSGCDTVGFANPEKPGSLLDALPALITPSGARRDELFTHTVYCGVDAHETEKYRALFRAIAGADLPDRAPAITLGEAVRRDGTSIARSLGLEPGRYVIGCPAGTLTVPLKAWPIDQYVEVAAHLQMHYDLPVLLVGSDAERASLEEIARAAEQHGVRMPVWSGGAGKIASLVGLMAGGRLYFGNDTGPMHVAAAVGLPVVARFGGGHWPRFLPMARRAFTVTQQLPCFECSWQCWLDHAACMTLIETKTFIEGVDWALSGDADERRIHRGRPLDHGWSRLLTSARNSQRRLESQLRVIAPPAPAHRRPKVLVVTPSFNQGRFLRETIESVLSQDYENLEYVVADGGSTDESVEILRSYGNRFRWTSASDGGQAAAIARAWTETDADIVAWLNSDDTYLPGAIATAVDYLIAHPAVSMVYGQAWYTNAAGERLEPYRTKPFEREKLAGECFICQPAAFVRRDVLTLIDPPDPRLRYCMDYDFWIRLSKHFRVDYLEAFLATSRMHPDNKTLGQSVPMVREIMAVTHRHFGAVHRAWVWEYARARWNSSLGRIPGVPASIRERAMAWLADRLRGDRPGFLDDDRWADRRTVFPVVADARGQVWLECECSPYAHPLRLTVSCEGLRLATLNIREPGRFVVTFTLPASVRPRAQVLLEADRSFVPLLRGLSTDPRALSFRILGQVARGATPPSTSQLPHVSQAREQMPATGAVRVRP
jgi:ADP-heptose:LPS heptosyltransferase